MIYYETFLFFFIFLTLIPIVVAFLFKNKMTRIICSLVSLPLLFIIISTISKHTSDDNKYTNQLLGEYKIDLQKSVYKSGDLTSYKGLTLTIYSNGIFTFNDSSMFPSQKGNWRFYSTEDGGFVRCSFPGISYETEVFAGNNFWGFQHSCFRNGSNTDIIYFKKEISQKTSNTK